MKKSKEYKTGIVLFSIALVLFGISLITGLIPNLKFSIDRICQFLGFASLCLGFVYMKKANDK